MNTCKTTLLSLRQQQQATLSFDAPSSFAHVTFSRSRSKIALSWACQTLPRPLSFTNYKQILDHTQRSFHLRLFLPLSLQEHPVVNTSTPALCQQPQATPSPHSSPFHARSVHLHPHQERPVVCQFRSKKALPLTRLTGSSLHSLTDHKHRTHTTQLSILTRLVHQNRCKSALSWARPTHLRILFLIKNKQRWQITRLFLHARLVFRVCSKSALS